MLIDNSKNLKSETDFGIISYQVRNKMRLPYFENDFALVIISDTIFNGIPVSPLITSGVSLAMVAGPSKVWSNFPKRFFPIPGI